MILYYILYFLVKYPLRLLFGFTVKGEENVPKSGGVILSANHINWFDPVAIAVSISRMYRAMAKSELFSDPFVSFFMRGLGAFPIKRGKADRRALALATGILQRGDALLMFPEGTRSKDGELHVFKSGVAVLSHQSGCPVVPAAIRYEAGFPLIFRKTVVEFGKPMFLSQFLPEKPTVEDYRMAAEKLRDAVAFLQEDEKKL